MRKLVDGSTKKTRKKSKKISEIEAPELNEQCMKTKTHDKCREGFALRIDYSCGDQLDLVDCLKRTNSLSLDSTSKCIEQLENFEKQTNDFYHASSIEEAQSSADIRMHVKSVKSAISKPRLCGTKKKI